uniref:Serine/threonine-protein kinase ATM n=1 Tax=Oryza brachyantha TaxID=4533 RepID=J3KVN7_ORYBR
MATFRDVDEIIEKLSSDRARTRDEGVKLLGTWLHGDRAFSFCRLLTRNTASLKPGHIPGSATWPFLILALAKCVIADISGKKRAPKTAAARMLRLAVQCAEDFRLSGRSLLLISIAKKLFSHIWEVVKDAPSFLIEYSIILRQLLTVKEYQYQMKPRTYSSFVVLYMKKVVTGFDEKFSNQASSKEESFRCTLTLHVLLENPPGDYPDSMREESLFITYAKVQLKLARAIPEILEKLLDVIIKELDHHFNTGSSLVWCEAPRDEKAGSLRCFQEELMDLSATVLYQACKCTPRTSNNEKKLKTEHVMTIIMDSLLKGSLVWSGSIYYLIHKYGYRVDKSLLISWFEATCKGLKSVLSNTNALRFQDSLLWLIRVLKEFSALLVLDARNETPFLLTKGEMSNFEGYWQDTWNCLIHALPLFSTTALVADSVLRLLSEMIMRDQVHASFVSEDTWDLQIFKQLPSSSALYFVACYFSKIGIQGDLSNSIFIRKNLLRSTLELVHSKGFSLLNEQNVLMIPETIFALCAGFSSPMINLADTSQLFGECKDISKDESWSHEEELGYSVEALSEINLESPTKVMSDKCTQAHLPRHIQQPLFLELLEFTKGFMSNEQFEQVDLPNLVYACALVCNLIHCSLLSRVIDEKSSFLQAMLDYVTNIIKHTVSVVMKEHAELSNGLTNLGSAFDTTGSVLSSFKSFMCSPIFSLWRVNNKVSSVHDATEFLDELLVAISQLFSQLSSLMNNFDGDNPSKILPVSVVSLSEDINPDGRSSLVDMDLDMTGTGEVDPVTAGGSGSMGISPRPLEYKLQLVYIISTFFSVVPLHTWEVLYDLAEKEVDVKAGQAILLELCTNISASSRSLSSVNQDILLNLVNRATEISSTDWFFRTRLINCISQFIYLFPDVAQDMIGHLLSMLHDTDYRVRLYLARKIVVLFQVWEGHSELFHDVCSNIGVKMVQFSNENPVKAREVLAIGPQPVPIIETALITLAHLSLQSEDVEVECIFMISAVAAIEPSQRELAYALFDSVSKRLSYASRSKYLDQLIGPILFRWVACEVSLVSLVEVEEMFGFKSAEPKNFIEHCCPWLLSFLILRGDTADLNWLSKILSQPLSAVIKRYFVPIFGLCIAARCGSGPEKDISETVLCESLLQLGEISEPERDDLIKKHMVSIVGFLLSVSSSSRQPEIPHFSKEAVVHSVKTVVDGFMEAMDGNLAETVVIDKINIFRSDRVFKFLLSIHQQIADANHPRHMRHRLCAIEVLIDVLGHRVALYSTWFYIICIVGSYIWRQPLQGQCCNILSKLLVAFNSNSSTETVPALGKQLQDLEPLPSLDCLKDIQVFHASLSSSYDSRDQFLKFVSRAPHLPPDLFLLSSSFVANEASSVLADFISRAGISDVHQVIFHVPNLSEKYPIQLDISKDKLYSGYGISDDILVGLLKLLKTCLSDDSVEIIDVTSRTLRGILSTASGLNALQSLDSLDRSLLMVHSRGINSQLVEQTLLGMENVSGVLVSYAPYGMPFIATYCSLSLFFVNLWLIVSLEDRDLWRTDGRSYKQWLCTLVGSLICHCDDIILRLCRSLAFLKVEAAEILLASALVNIAGNLDSNAGICRLISTMVEEIIFCDSNHLMKSVHLFLDALNVVRSYCVAEKARGCPSNALKDGRSVRSKSRSPTTTPSSSWKKVYWLSVDYLVAARAANRCSCDFATIMYVELWCEEKFNMLLLGPPDFSHEELLPPHIGLLLDAFTRINELDSIYGITLANEISSQIIRYEHEGDWSSALEYHDILVRSTRKENLSSLPGTSLTGPSDAPSKAEKKMLNWQMHKGLMRSLQKTGCSHVLDVYCQGLSSQKSCLQDSEFIDIQYETAWRAGNWDFSFLAPYSSQPSTLSQSYCLFNQSLHSCLRALQSGDSEEFHVKLSNSKMNLVLALSNASKESTKCIHSTVLKLQMLDHLTMVWDLRWKFCPNHTSKSYVGTKDFSPVPTVPTRMQLELLNKEWTSILCQTERNFDLLEPFLAFRSAVLKILGCEEHLREHLFQSASALRKGARFSLAAAALYELKELCYQMEHQAMPKSYFLFKLEEAKLLRAQGQHDMAISLGKYILKNHPDKKDISDVYRLVGKWLAETRSSNSRTIIDDYLRHSVDLTESHKSSDKKYKSRQCRTYFHLAHYTDGLFKSYEERLSSNEWQAALRLRKYKTRELETLIKRLKSSSKSEKTDYSVKIQELQRQLALDREEAEKIQDDRDKFLSLALQGYQRSLAVGGKYDLQVVFRLVSLWFSLFSREQVVKAMIKTTKEVQTYKFIPLVYQIASRLGSSKDVHGSSNFQNALSSLLKKMAIDHPYHTIFQLLALANGDRVKDRQRSRSSFIVDMDKKLAAENLLKELSSCHGALIRQMKQMVEIYIKLAELETKKEDTNKRIPLPREIRNICQLELVPVVTATIPVDPNCQYEEGSFPHFNGLADSIMIMNGINAPKVIECIGSDGNNYRQLAKSGNDDLRQDAVMEQFFSLVNMFLQNHRDTSERRLRIRTYKVVPFTPSAGVVEWVNGTVPLAEYLLGSTRSGGAHGRYGTGDWTYHQCRETMTNEKDKRKAFAKVCNNFRPVMHHFFFERFLQPADWFQSRLAYTRSVAASSMVGYIVGLGDRHAMNILIDQETAEVVHIDLGVAFEQGLMLKTPERVPFRLTRDIIDGMGVTGVEGVFRRSCEKTLSVMRANKEALLTIIEVFVHDPLYKWALSPLKALQRQKETDDTDSCLDDSQEAYEGNKDAARAILRVKQKLDGYEDGEMRSVQGQVQQLIQDAVDADRLCQMFPGWGAWL